MLEKINKINISKKYTSYLKNTFHLKFKHKINLFKNYEKLF